MITLPALALATMCAHLPAPAAAQGGASLYRETIMRRVGTVVDHGPYRADWHSFTGWKVPRWYTEGKFGIFIHWGVYSVPGFGSEWYPRQMYEQDSAEYRHHLAKYGPQSKFGYKDFIPMFHADRYDPEAWASLFREAGAKFVVPVAEHHDGFAMYDSGLSDWTAAKMGPKRDLIGDLAKAVRHEGMVFGLSSHRAEHWWFYNGGRAFDSDVQDPRNAGLYGPAKPENETPDKAFLDDWLARNCELVDKYRPQLFWFDWWINTPAFEPYLKRFAAYYYNRASEWKEGVAINYKYHAFPDNAAVLDIERGQLADTRAGFWQTDTSISRNSWGYVQPQDYKSSREIIQDLIDIVSKNGALLLNIGPRPDGTIPEPEQEILRDIGRWLKVNGEAIYRTAPFRVAGEGPTHVVGGAFNDTKRAEFVAGDVRYTQSGGKRLYAILLAWPGRQAVLRSLAGRPQAGPGAVTRVTMLGYPRPLRFRAGADGLVVDLPPRPEGTDAAWVLRIDGLGRLGWDGVITAAAGDPLDLLPGAAYLTGGQQVEAVGGVEDIGYWDDPKAEATWRMRAPRAGWYRVSVLASAQNGASQLSIHVGPVQAVRVDVPRTRSWGDYQQIDAGDVYLSPHATTVVASPSNPGEWKALNLARVRLTFVRVLAAGERSPVGQ